MHVCVTNDDPSHTLSQASMVNLGIRVVHKPLDGLHRLGAHFVLIFSLVEVTALV